MECLGRYNYDHVVDCWCFARASVRGGDWRGCIVICFWDSSRYQTTEILADANARSYSHANRLGSYCSYWTDSRVRSRGEYRYEYQVPGLCRSFSVYWTGCLDSNSGVNCVSCAGLERNSTSVTQFHFSTVSRVDRLNDAGREIAGCILEDSFRPWICFGRVR